MDKITYLPMILGNKEVSEVYYQDDNTIIVKLKDKDDNISKDNSTQHRK